MWQGADSAMDQTYELRLMWLDDYSSEVYGAGKNILLTKSLRIPSGSTWTDLKFLEDRRLASFQPDHAYRCLQIESRWGSFFQGAASHQKSASHALGNLFEEVLFMIAAHNKMASRNEAVMAILREMVAAEGSGMSCMHLGKEVYPEVRDGQTSWKIYRRRSLAYTAYASPVVMKPADKERIGYSYVILHVHRQKPNIDLSFRDDALCLFHHFPSLPLNKVCARYARRGDGWWSSSKDLRD